jgi:pimeloyl-ACP methyl ester carboxylesterase
MAGAAQVRSIPTAAGRVGCLCWPGLPAAPAVVLLHSLGQAADAWVRVAQSLVASHTVYALDLPGHGSSDLPKSATAEAAAASVAPALEAVAALARRPLHLVAHAYAAPVLAAALAHLEPRFGTSLTFVCALGVVPPSADLLPQMSWPQAVAARLLARRTERVRDAVGPLLAHPDRVSDAAWTGLSLSLGRAEALWRFGPDLLSGVPPLLPALGRLSRSACFVWCEDDPVFALAAALAAVEGAAGPRHHQVRLRGVGHLPMLEAPEALAAALRGEDG